MRVSASLCLKFQDSDVAEAVKAAILPEILSFKSTRTEVSLDSKRESLLLRIKSDGVSSLRASLNSYLRWILCAEETIRIVSDRVESPLS